MADAPAKQAAPKEEKREVGVFEAVELRQGKDGLAFVAEAPEAEPPPSQGWKKKT